MIIPLRNWRALGASFRAVSRLQRDGSWTETLRGCPQAEACRVGEAALGKEWLSSLDNFSRTVDQSHQVESPLPRHLPLVDLLVDTRAELMELAVASGLKVLTTMLEDDRTAICGARYQHQAERQASRAGTAPSEVVLGGRKAGLCSPAGL
jgi:hypothetical protein